MGYQECFITTINRDGSDAFIERIKILERDHFSCFDCNPNYIVAVKQNIHGVYDNQLKLEQNKKYVYFSGERFFLKKIRRILNANKQLKKYFADDSIAANTRLESFPFDLEIIFSDEVDCSKIFDSNKDEEGLIYAGLNNDFVEVTEFSWL